MHKLFKGPFMQTIFCCVSNKWKLAWYLNSNKIALKSQVVYKHRYWSYNWEQQKLQWVAWKNCECKWAIYKFMMYKCKQLGKLLFWYTCIFFITNFDWKTKWHICSRCFSLPLCQGKSDYLTYKFSVSTLYWPAYFLIEFHIKIM